MGKCNDQSIITHETQWEPQQCVDGGIFRAKRTYTNIETSGFNTNVGYSGNYYGIRKYDGLIPLAPYNVTIHGRSGDDKQSELPREINEWEYGSNNNVDYSGVKIISPIWGSGDKYGKSVGISQDFLAIGAPFATIYDSANYPLEKAGTVFVYKRNNQPSGHTWSYDKAEWLLDSQVNLPTEILRDYKEEEELRGFFIYDNTYFNLPSGLTITQTKWFVGQEGRQFGHSLDICSTTNLQNSLGENKKNILVISGPSCSFSRQFEEIIPSSINACFFIFTDNFYYQTAPYFYAQIERDINNSIREINVFLRFFSNPPTQINPIINVVESLIPQDTRPEIFIPEPKPKYINKTRITRHYNVLKQDEEFFDRDDLIFEQLKNYFLLSFPYDESKKNNNIPAIVGFYIDNSFTFGGERALQPALDRFINFYQEYSFASGLKDIYDIPSSGFTFKFPSTLSDDWVVQSRILLENTFRFSNLQKENAYTLFASELGQFNNSDPAFNILPPSGGAVFIFERESGNWNLIQTINSPTLSDDVYPDRFGHCVKISDNGEIIAIGSPYINDAILAYEYDINVDKNLFNNLNFENWLLQEKNKQNNFYYNNLWNTFLNLKQTIGQKEASQSTYLQLSQIDKYNYRKNYPVYKETFRYSYSDIQYGSWSFLVQEVSPTPRMGYSIAINEDGSTLVAGCPTDSINEFDDSTIYYAPSRQQYSTWHSYVNAGAVRVFESRKYFPHNTVVDYRKFGNLEYEISESGDNKYFSHLKQIYNAEDLNFLETDFVDVDIPEEAGLVFITTPQIDAASDEIIDNIKNWLSLGDRNLVLVGNDPIWEKDGLYFESNEIINKILRKLDSRMVITAARNEYESLPSGYLTHYDFNDGESRDFKSNVLHSYKTRNSVTFMDLHGYDLFASGVGDIKFYYPNAYLDYSSCDKEYLRLNNRMCKIPIKHFGDLRSEWIKSCSSKGIVEKLYSIDIPFFINDVNLANFGCGSTIEPINNTIKYAPVPLLVAAEPSPPKKIVYPAIPTTSSIVTRDIITGSRTRIAKRYNVDNVTNTNIDFIWSLDSGNYINIDLNTTNETHSSTFDHSSIGLTNGILQSISNSNIEESAIIQPLDNFAHILAEENYLNTNSKIILIATTELESDKFIDNRGFNAFFFNLVAKNENGDSFIAQLGDWTGHDSFQSAQPESILDIIFPSFFNTIDTNVSSEKLFSGRTVDGAYNEYDVAWIAKPKNLPNNQELSYIKDWLSRGNKKLIITYQAEFSNIQVDSLSKPIFFDREFSMYISNFNEISTVTELCKKLDIAMKPWYGNGNNNYSISLMRYNIFLNPNSLISEGFISKNSKVIELGDEKLYSFFIPINLNNSAQSIGHSGPRPADKALVNNQFWEFKTGITKVTFPTLPGSGYRIFINTEKNFEDLSLDIQLNRCIHIRDIPLNPIENKEQFDSFIKTIRQGSLLYSEFIDGNIRHIDVNQESFQLSIQKKPSNNIPEYLRNNVDFFDFVATDTSIDVMFNISQNITSQSGVSQFLYRRLEQDIRPKTEKLISISGTMLDIEETKYTLPIFTTEYDWAIKPGSPERIVIGGPKTRPISTSSKKYCPSQQCLDVVEDKLIDDGPVIVAQEMETFSNFPHGVKPSVITVISDSSLIQGKMITDNNDNIREDVILFLQSLYPNTVFPSDTRGRSFSDVISKIQAPERMTPQRLYSHTANIGHNINFQPVNYMPSIDGSPSVFSTNPQILTPSSGKPLSDYIEYFSGYLENEFIKAIEPQYSADPEYTVRVRARDVPPHEFSGIFNNFNNNAANFGGYSKFSSYINGKYYQDARPGSLPEIMKDTGFDYLDFEYFSSGYPGELFGYSVDIYKDKILIGAPFSCFDSENITNWEDVVNNTTLFSTPSGVTVGYNGGAGAVYLYEKSQEATGIFGQKTIWGCSRKFRPHNINIGQDTNDLNEFASDNIFGNHNYTSDDLLSYSITGDQFGRSVQIYSDIIAIGAPGHDFETYIEQTFNSGEFILKSFNESFDIPQRKIYDLGSSGVRSELSNSGIAVLNNGAIFTYENKLYNWQDRTQTWQPAQKLVPQGYNSRLQKTYIGSNNIPVSGSENDNFGSYIVLDKTKRSDSDYTLCVGTPFHKFGLSGNPILNVGCVYTYDGMLRRPVPAIIDKDGFIDIRVFGETVEDKPQVNLRFNNSIANYSYYASGIVFSNNEGEIFIEASGQDFTDKIYTLHRPYVKSIYGLYVFGENNNNSLNLKIDGQFNQNSGNLNLFSQSANSDIVYNTLGLYQSAILGIASGVPSGLFLYTDCPSGITISESGFALYASGTGFNPETLNLRVRGK